MIQIHNFWEKNLIKRYNFVRQNCCHRWSDRMTKQKFSCTDEAIKLVQFCAIKRHFCLNKHIFLAMKRSVQKPVFWSDAAIQYPQYPKVPSVSPKVSPMKRHDLRKSRKCIDYSDSILLYYFVLSTHLECLCLGWPYAYTHTRGLQRDVFHLGWLMAPSYMRSNFIFNLWRMLSILHRLMFTC